MGWWSWYLNKPPDVWVEKNNQKCGAPNTLAFKLEQVDSSQSCMGYCNLNAPYQDIQLYKDGIKTRSIKLDVVLTEYYKNSRECRCIGVEKNTAEKAYLYCEHCGEQKSRTFAPRKKMV